MSRIDGDHPSSATDLSAFGVVPEAEEPKHDREVIAEAFGVEPDALEITENEEIPDAFTFTAPLQKTEADTRFIANHIAKIGYDVLRGGETADHEWFVTVRSETDTDDDREIRTDGGSPGDNTERSKQKVETPQDALTKIAAELANTREKRLNTEPDTDEEAILSGRERGLRYAARQFEKLEGIEEITHLPEWSIALENESGEWEWYYPNALTRQTALQNAREEARKDLGDGLLNAYNVEGPTRHVHPDTTQPEVDQ